jgi:hypothetical protein
MHCFCCDLLPSLLHGFRCEINGFANAKRPTTNDCFPRTFYISFPKITLRLQLRLRLPRGGGYNGHRYQSFSRSTLKPDLASDMY